VFRVEDGKVAEHWAVRDDFAMIEQIRTAAGGQGAADRAG
jgi:predicted SnoaL-like aldol condensation-catalyzing enzyme